MKEKIYKRLLERYEKYHTQKLNQILYALESNPCPPEYNKRKWNGVYTNCYGYALDLHVSDPEEQIWTPSQISSKTYNHCFFTDVTGEIKKDLDFLGIRYRDNSDFLQPGEWRIAIYYKPTYHDMPLGFHVSRQDNDGCWSEKTGWSKKSKLLKYSAKVDTPPDLSEHNLYLENILILTKQV